MNASGPPTLTMLKGLSVDSGEGLPRSLPPSWAWAAHTLSTVGVFAAEPASGPRCPAGKPNGKGFCGALHTFYNSTPPIVMLVVQVRQSWEQRP